MSIDNMSSSMVEAQTTYRDLFEKIGSITDPENDSDDKRSNGNINGTSVMGKMLQYGTETSKMYALRNMLSPRFAKAHQNGDIHIHDLDFYPTKTTTCIQIPLGQMLKNGIWNEHGFLRSPKSIESAAALTAVILQSSQNQYHGGQAIPNLDFDLAPYVKITFEKNKDKIKESLKELSIEEPLDEEKIEKLAWERTEELTLQAMEALVHNLNTMHSRAGAQVVFSSINFGLDTSEEGRLVSKCLMQAQLNGLGKHETPIFPILIVKVKDGINGLPGDPNYDIFKMSIDVTAKRLFPNWVFEDAPFNKIGFDDSTPERIAYTSCATMGCRTRLFPDVIDGEYTSVARGNASFTSINLPRLAIKADHDIDKFYKLLDEKLELCHDQLLERYQWQCSAKPEEFAYIYNNNEVKGSDKWHETGNAEEYIKHYSLSIGFIGLAETLVALIGKHHGESEEAQKLGLEILQHMNDYCDQKKKEENLNWGILGTPAEGLSGRFTRMDKKEFGIIPGVTDKDYYTNSTHVPVEYKCSFSHKIEIEAPYHALEPAGHICYIELDGDPSKNPEAVEQIVNKMKKEGVGYGAINHPVDRCRNCDYQGCGLEECPICGSKDIASICRITGYLVGEIDRWNDGKQDELRHRITHDTSNYAYKNKVDFIQGR